MHARANTGDSLQRLGLREFCRELFLNVTDSLSQTPAELLNEATEFGIATELQFRRLLLKHRRTLLNDDREYLHSRPFLAVVAEDFGEARVQDMKRRQYCFSWEGLTRSAFELEFGQAYEEYARRRDGLDASRNLTVSSAGRAAH